MEVMAKTVAGREVAGREVARVAVGKEAGREVVRMAGRVAQMAADHCGGCCTSDGRTHAASPQY